MDQEKGNTASTLYHVGAIVSEKSYLRRLPIVLDETDRMRIDAIVFSCDVIEEAHHTLIQTAEEVGHDIEKLNKKNTMRAISRCWTIIDQLYAIRQTIQSMSKEQGDPLTQEFMRLSVNAKLLRNRMDHLAQNIKNISKKTGRTQPIFGTLSYVYAGHPPISYGSIVLVTAGSLNSSITMPTINPSSQPFVTPADLFELTAHGITLRFNLVLTALQNFIKQFEIKIEEGIQKQIIEYASKNDTSIEELSASPGAGLSFMLRFEIINSD